jgi:phosphoribosylformimino-5-aminoimidazole carboxamide ribonucleotide (ProFAR) isomerase
MLLIPAIDLKDGKCVRLQQGDMQASTTFGEDPAAMARRWLDAGARRLHLVDLNGAFAGKPVNEPAIKPSCARWATRSRCNWAAASAIWTPSSATWTTA